MASSPSEHEIQQRIRLACGRGAVRLWRNNTGGLVDQQGRFVRFGLCRGSSDLIGLRSLEVTPELVGQQLAQFVALEIKTPHGAVSPEQRAFLRAGPAARGCGGRLPLRRGGRAGAWHPEASPAGPLMDPAELQRRLRRLAQAHPSEHPYTLALRLQVETGKVITGQQAKRILKRLGDDLSRHTKA